MRQVGAEDQRERAGFSLSGENVEFTGLDGRTNGVLKGLLERIDAMARSKARAEMQGLLRSGTGRTLPLCRPRGRRSRIARGAAAVGSFVIVLVLCALGGLFVMLGSGPINLASLNPRIAQSLEERLGDRYTVSIGSTYLARVDSRIAIGFGGITIRDRSGRPVLSAPGGRVGLDAFSLLTLEVKVHRLEIDGLDLRLHLRQDGALSIAAAADSTAATIDLPAPAAPESAKGVAPDFGVVAFRIIDAMTGSSQSLDRVELTHGHLEVDNEARGAQTIYDDLSLAFDKSGDAATVRASARGPAGRWSIEASARGGDESREVSLAAHDLSLDDVFVLHAGRPPFEMDMPISFKVDARLTPDSGIRTLHGRFSLGSGYFKLNDPDHEPFLVDEATGDIAWNDAANRYDLANLQLLSGSTHLFASGWLAPPTAQQPAWVNHLESSDIVFGAERPGETPIVLDRTTFDTRFLPAESRFVVDRLAIHGPQVSGEVSGETAAVSGGATLKVKVRADSSDLNDMLRLWPSFINAEARYWCLQHIHGGQLLSGSMSVDWTAADLDNVVHKRAAPKDSVHGEFAAHDVAIDLLPGVPPLTGLDASGVITGHDFVAGAKGGVVELSPTRRIQVSDIAYSVPDTTPAPIVPALGSARLQGNADALADLLMHDALKRYAGFTMDPAAVKGQFDGKLALDLKMGKAARPEDNQFHADGSLTNFRVDRFLASERLDQATLSVLADHGDLKISGQGQMYGVPVSVDLNKAAADEGSIVLAMSFDNAARAKIGMPGGTLLNGAMGVRIKAPLSKTSADIDIDLGHVAIDSPQTGVLKAAGKPGKAAFTLKPGDDGMAINAITVDAGSIAIRGAAQLGSDGALQNAKLTQVRLSGGDDLKIDVQNSATAAKTTVRGTVFDARNLVKGFFGAGGPPGGGKDIDLDVKIANVIGVNSQALSQFELTGAWRGGAMARMQARGRIGNGELSAQQDDAGVLHARVTDAGALSKFLDLYGHMDGGTMDITMQDAGEASHGSANITDFVLRNEPALRQLAAAGQAPVAGAGDRGPVIDPDAARFEKLSASFTRAPGRLDLREAVIFNSHMGLTTQGYIDYARNRVDLGGTFIPAYQVNSLVTHIPVVGMLLGGGSHEGIFGVNYRIAGPVTGPTLTINPLSAMTPGFLRKVFGAVDGTNAPLVEDAAPLDGAPTSTIETR